MVVGLCELVVAIPGSSSLKQKRSAMRKAIERTRNRFPISIAEVDLQDKWQRGQIGFATVGNDYAKIQSILDRVIQFIEGLFVVSIIDVRQQIDTFSPDVDDLAGFRFD